MEIRFAEKKDLKAIIALCKAHAAYEKATFSGENKLELLENHLFSDESDLKCLVVEDCNEIVGYATFFKQFSTWEASYYLYLDCLFLNEQQRGKGVGKKLMELIKDYAISQACSIIQWQTPNFNEKAIQFYNSIGVKSKSKERFTWKV